MTTRHRSREGLLGRSLWNMFAVLLMVVVAVPGFSRAHAQGPDRSVPPTPGPLPSLKLPPIQKFTLSNGVSVMLLEKHNVPLVQVTLIVRAGSVLDPAGKEGLASLTAAMMTEGAGTRDALALADAIDFLGAGISVSAGAHTMDVSLFTPLSKLDSALVLMADVALRPTFPDAELERQRKERLTTLLQWRDEPNALASLTFSRTLYGNHPYGVPSIGSEASIRSVTLEDLRVFHRNQFVSGNATLVVVGDVTRKAITPRLEEAFGHWKRSNPSVPNLPAIKQVERSTITLIDKPGAAQTVVCMGRIGAPRVTDDFYTLLVMNTILGGSFTSRLNQNLRETHGYTYGAFSQFQFRLLPGPFLIRTSVQTAVTDSALAQILKEVRRMLEGVPDSDLERAKNYVALGFPADFQSVSQIAGRLEEMGIYGLPDDYVESFIGKILAVTKDDVLRVARKYLDPQRMAIVLVGDRSVIERGVAALGIGPVQPMTIDDVLGSPPSAQ